MSLLVRAAHHYVTSLNKIPLLNSIVIYTARLPKVRLLREIRDVVYRIDMSSFRAFIYNSINTSATMEEMVAVRIINKLSRGDSSGGENRPKISLYKARVTV